MTDEQRMVTVLGGKEVVVRLVDGQERLVRVRQLPIRLYGQLALALDEYGERLVELYTGQEPGWAEGLTTESQMEILQEGDAVNFQCFQRWVEQKTAAIARLAPTARRAMDLGLPGSAAKLPTPGA
jgi:hypothetical protein